MSNLLVFNFETDCYNTAKFLNTGVIVNFNVMSNIVLLLWWIMLMVKMFVMSMISTLCDVNSWTKCLMAGSVIANICVSIIARTKTKGPMQIIQAGFTSNSGFFFKPDDSTF